MFTFQRSMFHVGMKKGGTQRKEDEIKMQRPDTVDIYIIIYIYDLFVICS